MDRWISNIQTVTSLTFRSLNTKSLNITTVILVIGLGVKPMNKYKSKLWITVILWFYIGDIATTGIGIWTGGMTEASPMYRPILNTYGLLPMLFALTAVKTLLVYLFLFSFNRMESIYRYTMPAALILTGIGATAWNSYLILLYLL